VVTLPDSNVEALWEFIADTRELWLQEYRGIEPDLCFSAEMTAAPISLIPQELQDDLINAMEGCRDGMMSMLPDFPDTVETSSNLAIVESTNGRIDIKILARSASESRKEWISSSLESIFSLAGAQVEYGGAYSGWQPDINSDILRTLRTVYHNLYGRYPGVKVVHAGLECGIIQESYPDMKMISLGPDLVCPHSPAEAVRISSVRRVWDFLLKSLAVYGSGI
jgi:dipeptidase D